MKPLMIIVNVIGVAALASGVGVLIWWLVTREALTTTVLEGDGFDGIQQTAAVARIRNTGDMFWWFFPSEANSSTTRPLILWLDGVTGLPPSLLANFGMIGPLDFNLNKRDNSWVDEFNLLFIDAPLGTGFSTARSTSSLAHSYDDTTDHLLYALESFYSIHEEYQDTALYILGQGDGAPLALFLASRIPQMQLPFIRNLQGVVLGNPIVSPTLVLTKLGFYLDEMGYVDPDGRVVVEEFATELQCLVTADRMEEAFDKFLTLEEFINKEVGAAAVNLGHILQKLTTESTNSMRDYFGQQQYLRSALQLDIDFGSFMKETIAPALGLSGVDYDNGRTAALDALKQVYMNPCTELVEYILENTDVSVTIYNGNLDAISTTPGQLEWVNKLQWSGQAQFLNSSRQTLVVNGLVEGYFRQTDRLSFYWMNAAGVSVPLDSPTAMKRVIQVITNSNYY